MATKRKADEEILEILSDGDEECEQEDVARNCEDDGNDSDVQIQEKTIPIVTVEDDEDESEPIVEIGPQAKPEKVANESNEDSVTNPAEESSAECPGASFSPTISRQEPEIVNQGMSEPDNKLLLSLKFRDAELFQLFKGSLTEYLKTTFQLKLAGQEVDVVQQIENYSIKIISKQTLAKDCPGTPTPVPSAETPVKSTDEKDNDAMFVIDSTPAKTAKGGPIIPSYRKALQKVLDNSPSASGGDSATKKPKPRQACWNCDGEHSLRDCKEPRNFAKISKMKQEHMKKMDRYHVDLEQKYGHIVPGRLTPELRDALGLRKHDLPMHVYRMRIYGYPPGWLEDAKITHSGLQLFDSQGDPVQNSDESEGEVDNVRAKYDVRKIVSFPGFNVAPQGHFYDDAKFLGIPPRMEHQSRDTMIRSLEGTLVQGYRRKKLRLTTEGNGGGGGPTQQSQTSGDSNEADMDLDNPDESFTVLDSVGECDSMQVEHPLNGGTSTTQENNEPEEGEVNDDEDEQRQKQCSNEEAKNSNESPASPSPVEARNAVPAPELEKEPVNENNESTAKDDSLILVEEEVETISLDDSRASSPSLEDLRRKQMELLKQLEDQSPSMKQRSSSTTASMTDLTNEDSLIEDVLMAERLAEEEEQQERVLFLQPAPPLPPPPPVPAGDTVERPPEPEFLNLEEIKMSKLPFIDDPASTGLKTMSLGTPILTPFTPWNRLPCGEAFSQGVSDVINFENLPNSTGKYERMKSLLSKVRTVIHAHNGEAEPDAESR